MKVRIEQIEAKLQGCSPDKMSEYMRKIRDGVVERPFQVRQLAGEPGQPPKWRLLDSFIRFQAAIRCGITEVEVVER